MSKIKKIKKITFIYTHLGRSSPIQGEKNQHSAKWVMWGGEEFPFLSFFFNPTYISVVTKDKTDNYLFLH